MWTLMHNNCASKLVRFSPGQMHKNLRNTFCTKLHYRRLPFSWANLDQELGECKNPFRFLTRKYQISYDKLNRCKLIFIAYCPHFDSDLHPNLQNTRCKASSIHYKWVASIGRSQLGSGSSRNIRIWSKYGEKKPSVLFDIISLNDNNFIVRWIYSVFHCVINSLKKKYHGWHIIGVLIFLLSSSQ